MEPILAPAEKVETERMIDEGGPVPDPHAPLAHDADDEMSPESGERAALPTIQARVLETLHSLKDVASNTVNERVQKLSEKHLRRLTELRTRGDTALASVPDRMHFVANQAGLILQLLDDFRDGTYREIPWSSIALLAGATLYAVSPADVVPDVIPGLGGLDDLAVITFAVRLVQTDLRKYCKFKGYPVAEYFVD